MDLVLNLCYIISRVFVVNFTSLIGVAYLTLLERKVWLLCKDVEVLMLKVG